MSASGSGRGRGWLNFKDSTLIRPGDGSIRPSILDDINTNSRLYPKLFCCLEQLDFKDDDILVDKKLKVILKHWREECTTAKDVRDSFRKIYKKCLEDTDLAKKVATMMTYNSLDKAIVRGVNIRKLFSVQVDNAYKDSEVMQLIDPNGFRNSFRLLVGFYHLEPPQKYDDKLITYVTYYLVCLLKSAEPLDLELFTCLAFETGTRIESDCPKKFQDIIMQVRLILIKPSDLTPKCRAWLMLFLDLCKSEFTVFSLKLQKFYQEQLGEEAMSRFPPTRTLLSIHRPRLARAFGTYPSIEEIFDAVFPDARNISNRDGGWDIKYKKGGKNWSTIINLEDEDDVKDKDNVVGEALLKKNDDVKDGNDVVGEGTLKKDDVKDGDVVVGKTAYKK